MRELFRILVLQDRPDDAKRIRQELLQTGHAFVIRSVQNETDYLKALPGGVDIILADDRLPHLPPTRALELLAARGVDIPLIVLTDSIRLRSISGELLRGAADYVSHKDLARLGYSITRALADRASRNGHRPDADQSVRGEHWFRALFETSPLAISVSRHGVRLYANNAYARLLGYDDVAELINLPIETHLAPQFRDEVLRHIKPDILEPDLALPFEIVAVCKDGSLAPVRVQVGRIELPDGIANVSFVSDLAEQKRVEAAEHDQRELSEALRDTAATLTSTLNPDEVMARVLENIRRVVPYDSANVMLIEDGQIRVAYWHHYPPECDSLFETLRLPLSTPNVGAMLSTNSPHLIADTRRYSGWISYPPTAWVRSQAGAPIRVHGQVIGFLNLDSRTPDSFNDLHSEQLQVFADQAAVALENAQLFDQLRRYAFTLEQRVAQRTAELYQTKEHVEAILNNSSDAIVVTALDGAISQINPAFSTMFALQAAEVLGRSMVMLATPGYAKDLAEALMDAIDSGQPRRIEIMARRGDNTSFNADVVLSPIINRGSHSGEIGTSGIVGSLRDNSERKQVEKELQELNRLKTEFLSTAAHELRTPLTAIRGFSELLLTRTLEPERQQRFLTLIQDQSAQLGQLIDDLLDISRLESRRGLTLELSVFRVDELLTPAMAPFLESAARHHIKVEGLAGNPSIVGDLFRLGQVVKNLLSNAVKYSPDGGAITLRCRRIGEEIEIGVSDQGIGIRPEQQTHLFEQFFRADASNTGITGTGLGLAISKRIVELHGGRIWAESTYGVGSTFFFALPIASSNP